jgi:predicted DNA binding protein
VILNVIRGRDRYRALGAIAREMGIPQSTVVARLRIACRRVETAAVL